MWTLDAIPNGNLSSQVEPKEVLYYYDGPILFSAYVGLTLFLFYKVNELQDADIFLVVPTTPRTLQALKHGSLSVRGALLQSEYWLIEIDRSMTAKRYWAVAADAIPRDYIPDAGHGIATGSTHSADSVEQACAFFSIRLAGERLARDRLPFGLFKGLIDNVYDAVRKIFPSPLIDQHSVGRVFDFEVLEPKFGSLIVAIDEPTLDKSAIKKDLRERVSQELVTKSVELSRDDFFGKMNAIVDEAKKGEIQTSFAIEHFLTLDQVNEIIPTEENSLDTVEFRSGLAATKPVIVDDKLGSKIRRAHRIAESSDRRMRGVVVEINSESGTFIIKDIQHRLTTCVSDYDTINRLGLSINARVEVSGSFQRRTRRDLMNVRSVRLLG